LIQQSKLFLVLLVGLVLPTSIHAQTAPKPAANKQNSTCPPPILSRLQRHRIASGETIETIASKYNLRPATLVRLNSVLKGGSAPVGKEILIPPIDGIRVEAPANSTWQDLEGAYGVRADVLFELNGCQPKPKIAFIPGANWSESNRPSTTFTYTGLAGYPLPSPAEIGLAYGWYEDATGNNTFHSGIDLLASVGTNVLTVDVGTVAYAGQQGNYGYLVVVNHSGGRQTRYAHLASIKVKDGQKVKTGDILGTVGITGRPDISKPHLHFEVRYSSPFGWVAQDPAIHLK
jgi:murein DD-endopeptidase MepM/ murein hydrolase activator NlpD